MAVAERSLGQDRRRGGRWLLALALAAALLGWFFRGAIFGDELFAFRDTAHYYYPLYRFVHGEWSAGRLPLWNPYENLGQPLAGDPTAAVFYPGKLLFALPIGYDAAFRLYVIGHVALAAVAAFVAARRFTARLEAAVLAALAYAFSGSVLFQYCNVVYLVGAAWLPLGFGAIERMLSDGATRSARAGQAAALAVVLAMMILGGDVQSAYHLGLLAVLRAVIRRAANETEDNRTTDVPTDRDEPRPSCLSPSSRPPRWSRSRAVAGWFGAAARRLCWVGLASAAAAALAAVQILPAWHWTGAGARAAVPWRELASANFTPGTHGASIHEFSVGPWRWAEAAWPNVAGRQFPIHRRWFSAIPAEGRIWTPSLYFGAMPLVFALGTMRFRPRRTSPATTAREPRSATAPTPPPPEGSPRRPMLQPDAWLSWVAVVSLLAALGWFGLGWLLHESVGALGGRCERLPVGPPFGGLYWFLSLVLPGYARFRYPAKWLVVTTAALALLAARGFDAVLAGRAPRITRHAAWFAGLSACGAMLAVAVRPWWSSWLAGAPSDPLFGPLDSAGAWSDLCSSFVQTGIFAGLLWWLARRAAPAESVPHSLVPSESGAFGADSTPASGAVPHGRRPSGAAAVVLLATALDLAAANGWMVATAPTSLWHRRSAVADAMRTSAVSAHAMPRADAATADRAEPPDGIAGAPVATPRVWRRPLWLPRRFSQTASAERFAVAVAWDRDTLFPKHHLAEHICLTDVRGALDPAWPPGRDETASGAQRPRYHPRDLAEFVVLPGDEMLPDAERIDVDVDDVSLWRRPEPPTRVFIERERATGGTDLRVGFAAVERCCIVAETPSYVEIEAVLTSPGRVVLADRFDPGWRLEVASDGQAPRRAAVTPYDGWLRAVELPSGRHRLVYRYRPTVVAAGALLSAAAWVVLLVSWAVRAFVGRRRHGKHAG